MTTPLGLITYRFHNNVKTALLFGAFPALLVFLILVFFYATGSFYANERGLLAPSFWAQFSLTPPPYRYDIQAFALEGTKRYAPYALGAAALWTVIGYFFHSALVSWATGSRSLERREAPEVYNALENLCISRGLKMPPLNLIDTPEMNAFASGLGPGSYEITVTRGLILSLNKEELEAVLGHELTHIMNRDVRLVLVTALFAGMLSFFSDMVWRVLRYRFYIGDEDQSNDNRKNASSFFILLLAGVLLLIGMLISALLKLALSRRREYMADAGAVELTKNPEALISALEKISGHADLPGVPSGIRAMFIENPPLGLGFFDGLFSTHPPIEARIAVLRRLGGLPPRGTSPLPSTYP